MYARISRARFNPELRQELQNICAQLRERHADLPGVKYWMNFITDDHEVVVIATYETAAQRDDTAAENERRWASAAHLLVSEPIFANAEMAHFVEGMATQAPPPCRSAD